MNLLELRYRGILRLLPASYRAEREEEMVAAYLEYAGDVPDELNPRPRWDEIASVLGLAVRVRLGGAAGAPRYFAWGETVRLIAVFGLAFQAAFAVMAVVNLILFRDEHSVYGAPLSVERLASVGEVLATGLWAVAFAALMRGGRGGTRVAKVSAALAATFIVVRAFVMAWPDRPLISAYTVLAVVPVLALLAGFHRDAPAPRRPWWIAALPPATGALLLYGTERVIAHYASAGDLASFEITMWLATWLDLVGLASTAIVLAGTVCLARRAAPAPLLALAALATLMLLFRGLDLLQPYGDARATWDATLAQSVVLGVTAIVLAVAGLRRMPPLDALRERSG